MSNADPNSHVQRPGFWERPLGYPHAALVVATAFALGCAFHARSPRLPSLPLAVAAAECTATFVSIAAACFRWRHKPLVQWLTGIPFAVTSITGVMMAACIGAAVPQRVLQERFGVESAYASWPFATLLVVMLFALIGVCSRRMWPLDMRNVRFLLNHLGLAVTLGGAIAGSSGLERLTLVLEQGRRTSTAEDRNGKTIQLPFTIALRQFHLDTFPPSLAIAASDRAVPSGAKITPGAQFVRQGVTERIGGYTVRVNAYLPRGGKVGGTWRAVGFPTAAPATRVSVTDAAGKRVADGWITCGSMDVESEMLPLSADRVIFMPPPRPREFRSTVVISEHGKVSTRNIVVNHPVTVAGYRLYQVSYDERMGAASEFSVIEAVRDRSLPFVYAGLFMMLAGAAMLLWQGSREGGTE